MSELSTLDATAQAELVRTGAASPLELVDAAIARIERHDAELNAVIVRLFDSARATAMSPLRDDAPFRGVPILVKDLLATVGGTPYAGGLRLLKEAGYRSPHDSYLVARLRGAGFVIAGKTSCSELGIVPTTEPVAWGPSRNPWNAGHSTGGSSGGSAAAVAAGLVPIAHANDGGGSIRIPASCCGLVGLKPSRGRASLGPDHGDVMGGLVNEGVVARSVRDAAALLDVLAGAEPGDPYAAPPPARPFAAEVGAPAGTLRVGFATRYMTPTGQLTTIHPECAAAVHATAKLLADLGHRVEEVELPALHKPEYVARFLAVWSAGVAADLDALEPLVRRTLTADDVEPLGHRTRLPRGVELAPAHRPRDRRRVDHEDGCLAHAHDHATAAAARLLRQLAAQPARGHLQGGGRRAVHRALQRHRPARDLAAHARRRGQPPRRRPAGRRLRPRRSPPPRRRTTRGRAPLRAPRDTRLTSRLE
jgi:amidase